MPAEQELLIDLLQEVNRGLSDHMRDVVSKHKLPLTTIIIARQIYNEPGITISSLSRKLGIAKSHISNVIEEFNRRGWVEKKPDPDDQRLLRLLLTQSAIDQLKLVRAEMRKRISELVSGISEDRTEGLIKGLKDIRAALEQLREGCRSAAGDR